MGWFSGKKPSKPSAPTRPAPTRPAPTPVPAQPSTAIRPGDLQCTAGDMQFKRGDLDEAVRHWLKAAADGNTQAMINLGFVAIETGNPAEGQSWFTRATGLPADGATAHVLSLTAAQAKTGNSDALVRLGTAVAGSGATVAGIEFLRQAADKGHVHALWQLSLVHGPTSQEGFGWFQKAYEARHPKAVFVMRGMRAEEEANGG